MIMGETEKKIACCCESNQKRVNFLTISTDKGINDFLAAHPKTKPLSLSAKNLKKLHGCMEMYPGWQLTLLWMLPLAGAVAAFIYFPIRYDSSEPLPYTADMAFPVFYFLLTALFLGVPHFFRWRRFISKGAPVPVAYLLDTSSCSKACVHLFYERGGHRTAMKYHYATILNHETNTRIAALLKTIDSRNALLKDEPVVIVYCVAWGFGFFSEKAFRHITGLSFAETVAECDSGDGQAK